MRTLPAGETATPTAPPKKFVIVTLAVVEVVPAEVKVSAFGAEIVSLGW